jgi:hypothetical protein
MSPKARNQFADINKDLNLGTTSSVYAERVPTFDKTFVV